MGYLKLLDYIIIGFYALAMLAIGFWSSRKQQSVEEYFVARRGVMSWMAGLSMAATLLSTISYLTTPGELIKNGPGMMFAMLHLPFTFLIVGYLIIPHIMKYRIVSAYELLEKRFGMKIRQTASAMFVLFRIPWAGFIIFTCCFAIGAVVNVDRGDPEMIYLMLGMGLLTTMYTVAGGIRAVMITDVIQFIILVSGALLAIGYATYACGGFSWWPSEQEIAALQWPKLDVFSWNPFRRVTVVSAVFATVVWWICTASSDQVVIQRYLCTRDVRQARRSLLNCLFGDLISQAALWIVGLALLGFFLKFAAYLPDPNQPISRQADELFPMFIAKVLPAGLSGLVLAALLAAAMSSLSSGISSIGSVLLTDFKSVFARGCNNDDRRLVRRAKYIGFAIGLISTGVSLMIVYVPGGNLFEVGFRIGEFFAAPVLVLFLMAFFIPFSTPAGGWTAIAVGFLSGVLFSYWKQIVGCFREAGDFSIILILPASIALSMISGIIVSRYTRPRSVDADITA